MSLLQKLIVTELVKIFPTFFSYQTVYTFLICPMRATSPAHLNVLYFTVMIWNELTVWQVRYSELETDS